MKRPALCLAAVLVLAAAIPATAQGQAPQCGDVITADVHFTASVSGCSAGLVVGADDVTIDLDGHALEGAGAPESVGIDASGHRGVVVTGGIIRNFGTGVALRDTADSRVAGMTLSGNGITMGGSRLGSDTSHDNAVIGNVLVGGGIAIFGSRQARVVGNTITGAFVGIGMQESTVEAFAHNVSSHNEFGVTMYEITGPIHHNVADDNARTGFDIARSHLGLGFERNTANGNGDHGVFAWDTHGRYIRNRTNGNGAGGLLLTDLLPGHGQYFTVAGNVANANGELGISAPTGTIDGGKNRAHANGDPRQCLNVTC